MKCFIFSIVFLFSLVTFSQDKSNNKAIKSFDKTITQISKADTVYFTADNSGCFDSYVLEMKMCKLKSGGRKLISKSKKGKNEKSISATDYNAFVNNYKASINHFIAVGEGKCTSSSSFRLMYKINKEKYTDVTFINSTCEAEYNPEMFLENLIRANEGVKK